MEVPPATERPVPDVAADEEEVNDSPIEQVRLTVPITDDPTLPVLTFRTWLLGPITCVLLAMLMQLTGYRQFGVSVDSSNVQLLFLPIGKLMAAKIPARTIHVPGTKWSFSTNPGPFNMKEHFLLVTFATTGLDGAMASKVITITKAMYHKNIGFWASFLLVQSSQMLGYGLAGMFIKFLVNSPYMWWPSTLPDVVFYRTLHEEKKSRRRKGQLTRMQFFTIVSISSFAYCIIPSYFFPSLTAISFICLIWKDSVMAHQIGSGLHGLGIGSFTLNWPSITSYSGDPLVQPMFVSVNFMIGFILITYIIAPIGYWTNSHNAKRFPFISNAIFDVKGQAYNVSRIMNDDLTLNQQAYDSYSPIHLSLFFIYATGFQLASEAATFTHFILYHARDVWQQFIKQRLSGGNRFNDAHNRMMNKYEPVPRWWFYSIILSTIILAILNSMFYGKQFQLSYWTILLGYLLPFILILPGGVIQATTGQVAFNIYGMSQLLIGSIYPGKPIANAAFQSYTTSTLNNAIWFLSELKLGHYMKIPPKSMFIVQITGTLINTFVCILTQWWIFSTVEHICDTKNLPKGSPWTCPFENRDFTTSMIWGGVGTTHMFAPNGQFSNIYIFVIIGVIATVVTWILTRMFPGNKWVGLIHVPLILLSGVNQPPAGAVNYWSMFTVAIIFNFIIYRKHKEWWAKYNYLLSSALYMGISLMNVTASLSLQMSTSVYGVQWWGLEFGDHCPLANCPTAPGIKVDGCPVF